MTVYIPATVLDGHCTNYQLPQATHSDIKACASSHGALLLKVTYLFWGQSQFLGDLDPLISTCKAHIELYAICFKHNKFLDCMMMNDTI